MRSLHCRHPKTSAALTLRIHLSPPFAEKAYLLQWKASLTSTGSRVGSWSAQTSMCAWGTNYLQCQPINGTWVVYYMCAPHPPPPQPAPGSSVKY